MITILLAIAFGGIVASIIGLILYARWNYGVLESLNIPVVKRSFLLGSTPELHKTVQHLEDIKRFRTLGPVYGLYEGRYPHIHVCDPELIRMIFVKDVDHFKDRRLVELGHPIMNEMLDFLPYAKWKVLRQKQTTALTGAKLKHSLGGNVDKAALEYLDYFKKQVNQAGGRLKIDCRRTFVPVAADMIGRGLLSIQVEDPCSYDNEIVQNLENLMSEGKNPNILYSMSFSYPFLASLAPAIASGPVNYFANFFRHLIRGRLSSPAESRQNDFMDKVAEMSSSLPSPEFKNLGITEMTVLAQVIGPLLAGYDALATTMSFLAYYLASDPEKQDKVRAEIDAVFEAHDGTIKYEHLNELEYLSACVKETLRLVPPFIRPERICTKDWEYNGLKIKKGCVVMMPAWAANRNPECFTNPDDFEPERFLEEQTGISQYGFTTFGHGPRNCIGAKFSTEALKLVLCHLLRNFNFQLRPDTKIVYRPGVVFLLQYEPLFLDVVRRDLS